MLPSAELLPLSASPSLSQGQVGVTGTAGPAGARGRSVSHLVSLSPFGMIADGGGGHICDQEHRAGLKLVSPGFFLTPKQGSTGLRGPPGPQGLEGAKVRGGRCSCPSRSGLCPSTAFPGWWGTLGGPGSDPGTSSRDLQGQKLARNRAGSVSLSSPGRPRTPRQGWPHRCCWVGGTAGLGLWSWELSEALPGLCHFQHKLKPKELLPHNCSGGGSETRL